MFTGSENAVTEHLLTPLSVKTEGDDIILDDKFVVSVKGARVWTDTLEFNGDMKFISVWDCEYLTRINIEKNTDNFEMTLRRK